VSKPTANGQENLQTVNRTRRGLITSPSVKKEEKKGQDRGHYGVKG